MGNIVLYDMYRTISLKCTYYIAYNNRGMNRKDI